MNESASTDDLFDLSRSCSDSLEETGDDGVFGETFTTENGSRYRQLELQDALEELQISSRHSGGNLENADTIEVLNLLLEGLDSESSICKCLATEILIELIPRYGTELDADFGITLPKLVCNVGHEDSKVRRCSVQSIHLFLQNTKNLHKAIQTLVKFGLRNNHPQIRTELMLALPLLITQQFAYEDLHDLIYTLASRLSQSSSFTHQEHPAIPCFRRLKTTLGTKKYNAHIGQLPVALQEHVLSCESRSASANTPVQSYSRGSRLDNSLELLSPDADVALFNNDNGVCFGFVPQQIMLELRNKNDYKMRAQGIEKLKFLVGSVTNPDILFEHLDQFIPFLLSYFDDVNFKVIVASMEVLNILVSKLTFNLKPYVPQIIKSLQIKLGELNLVIKQVTSKSYLKLMQIFSPSLVLREIAPGVKHRSSKTRESTVNLVTAGLLTFPSSDFDMTFVSSLLAPLLLDQKQTVRQAALECFSVIAQSLGPGRLAPIVSAVDKVEMMPRGEGAMAAVQAKLGRRQLPRLGTNGLIEYSLFLPNTVNTEQTQPLDVLWILAGKPTVMKGKESSQSVDLNANMSNPPLKRFLSAGKKRLPWESAEDFEKEQVTRKSVGSAPVRVKSPTSTKHNHQRNASVNTYMTEKSPSYLENHLNKNRHALADSPSLQRSTQPTSYYEMYKSKMKRLKAAGLQADHQMLSSLGTGNNHARPVVLYSKGALGRRESDSSPDDRLPDRPGSLSLSPNSQVNRPLSPVITGKSKGLSMSLSELEFIGTTNSDRQQDVHRVKSPRGDLRMDTAGEAMSPIHVKPQIGRPTSRRRHSLSEVEEVDNAKKRGLKNGVLPTQKNHTTTEPLDFSPTAKDGTLVQSQALKQPVPSEPVKSPFDSQPRIIRTPTGERSPRITASQSQLTDVTQSNESCEVVGFRFPYKEKGKPSQQKKTPSKSTSGFSSGLSTDNDSVASRTDDIAYTRRELSGGTSHANETGRLFNNNANDADRFSQTLERNEIEVSGTKVARDIDHYTGKAYGLSNSAKARIKQKQLANKEKQQEYEKQDEPASVNAIQYQPFPTSDSKNNDSALETGSSGSPFSSKENNLKCHTSALSLHGNTILPTPFHGITDQSISPNETQSDLTDIGDEGLDSTINNSHTIVPSKSHDELLDQFPEEPNDRVALRNKLKIGQSPKARRKSPSQSSQAKEGAEDVRISSAGKSLSEWNISVEQLMPLQNPEQSLSRAFSFLAATAEEWENICEGLILIRRLAAHHAPVLAQQLHAVMVIINKELKNLRSQVPRIAISCLSDLFASLSKQMESELDPCVSILLSKTGELNAFVRSDVEKALHSLVSFVNPSKALAVLIAGGATHRNAQVRKTAAKFIAELADRIGSHRIANGSRDISERLLPCITQLALDMHPETRYYGRRMVLLLIDIPDIERLLLKHTSRTANAKALNSVIETLRTKGLGEPPPEKGLQRLKKSASDASSSVSPHKALTDPSVVKSPSCSTTPDAAGTHLTRATSFKNRRRQESSSSSSSSQAFDFDRLSLLESNDWKDRLEGIDIVYELARLNPSTFGSNVIKIGDKFVPRLADSNSKVLLHSLQTFVQIVPIIGDGLGPIVVMALQSLTGCIASKNHAVYAAACQVLDCFVQFVDGSSLVQSFATAVQFGNSRVKPEMTRRMADIVGPLYAKKSALVHRHILPVTWYLLSNVQSGSTSGAGRISMNDATSELCQSLYQALGDSFLSEASSKGSRTRQRLDGFLRL